MATEYDLLRSLLSHPEQHNQRTTKPVDKRINIGKLLSLLHTKLSWLRALERSRDHRRAR